MFHVKRWGWRDAGQGQAAKRGGRRGAWFGFRGLRAASCAPLLLPNGSNGRLAPWSAARGRGRS